MQKRLKILISAYACGPGQGSEPGMGWNFVLGLSKYHEVHVISEKLKWEKSINEHFLRNPEHRDNLHFYFIEKKRNKALRKIWPPSYYWYYKAWQKKAFELALYLDRKENFDLVHQLNMVGYREPGYLWKMNKPFVWGPIGGFENSPFSFLPSLGLKGFIFYAGRNLFNIWQKNFLPRVKAAALRTNSALIGATSSNCKIIKEKFGRQLFLIPEVGAESVKIVEIVGRQEVEPLKIIWSGQHIARKNLPLLIAALKDIPIPYELHVLGVGEMTKKWKSLAEKSGVEKPTTWYGWIDREEALQVMQSGHVMCITSISDLTSTVTLEALSFGLPIICLDHCGFADVVTDSSGIKIPVTNPSQAAKDFQSALVNLYRDENHRQKLARGALDRASDYNWENKINFLNDIYYTLLDKKLIS